MTHRPKPSAAVGLEPVIDTVRAGASLDVTVRCAADRSSRITGGELELVRTRAVTHFRRWLSGSGSSVGDRQSGVLARAALAVPGPVRAGEPELLRGTLDVPPGEATIAGHLVEQQYLVRARIRVDGDRDVTVARTVRITLAATDPGRVTSAPGADDAGVATLGLEELSGRQLRGGVPLSGVVTVRPHRAGSARGARVELVLAEHVPARAVEQVEEDRDAQTVVAAVSVAEHLDLRPDQPLRLPFVLPVPQPLPAPSVSTPEFRLRWLLRAVLDRPLRRDAVTTVELPGVTG